jgi:tRNA-specific 2-thiouridylase
MILSSPKKDQKPDYLDKVKALGKRFNIPIVVVDLKNVFEQHVISPFVEAYLKGLTPNPCAVCNPKIKFGFLLDFWKTHAKEICSSFGILGEHLPILATGHYVSLIRPEENPYGYRYGIKRHKDYAKDQSYFLYGLSQDQLGHALFPLASETKQEVATWATSLGLQDLVEAESQEICFIPSGDYVSFLEERIPTLAISSGPIKNSDGQILGYHRGLHRYTIGRP